FLAGANDAREVNHLRSVELRRDPADGRVVDEIELTRAAVREPERLALEPAPVQALGVVAEHDAVMRLDPNCDERSGAGRADHEDGLPRIMRGRRERESEAPVTAGARPFETEPCVAVRPVHGAAFADHEDRFESPRPSR